VLETSKDVQLYVIIVIVLISHSSVLLSLSTLCLHFDPVFVVSVLWFPFVLVQDADQLFNVGREVVVLRNQVFLLFSFKVID
jgi:hypothetical protein